MDGAGGGVGSLPHKLNEPEREGHPWVSPSGCLLAVEICLVGIDQLHVLSQICILEIFSPVCGFSQHSLKSGFQRENNSNFNEKSSLSFVDFEGPPPSSPSFLLEGQQCCVSLTPSVVLASVGSIWTVFSGVVVALLGPLLFLINQNSFLYTID